MAGASDKINSLIAREFSFVQELVWLPPRRNPFPQCTDKIVSDFRRLEVLFRHPANVAVRAATGGRDYLTSSRRAADHAVSILNADAEQLIKLRRSLCKQLISVQLSSSLNNFENQAEALILQHLNNAWGSCKHGSVEIWASKVKGLDFQALDKALQHRFESSFCHHVSTSGKGIGWHPAMPIQSANLLRCHYQHLWTFSQHLLQSAEHVKGRHDLGEQGRKSSETQSESDATSLHDDDEDDNDDDDVSEVDSNEGEPVKPVNILSCNTFKRELISKGQAGGTASHNQGLPLVLISNNEVGHESKPNVRNTNNRKNLPAQIEMTMKARICVDHITAPEENCWHIIFGLVNHDHGKVAVHSLCYWSFDNESEVSTIKWPKGGVILKEAPSFLCYSCQVRCTGSADSPRVAFSWQYRSLQKYPAALRGGSKEPVKDRAIEPPSLELRDSGVKEVVPLYIADTSYTALAKLDVPAPSQTPRQRNSDRFFKRLGDFLPWKESRKKANVTT